jgi:hypothetical protein
MESVVQIGAFTAPTRDIINRNFAAAGLQIGLGEVIYLAPASSLAVDSNDSGSPLRPFKSWQAAYNYATAGANDVIVLVGDGTTTATARINEAFTWTKDALHVVGACSPSRHSQRARFAPLGSVTAFANFWTMSSADGCVFQNLQWFQGFDTGTTSAIAMTLSSCTRNVFLNCHIAGMGDTESVESAGSRCLKITGGGENRFVGGVIGLNTTQSDAANATIEFAGGTTRNVFEDVILDRYASDGDPLFVIVSATAGSDRYQLFDRCKFINMGVGSAGAAMTAGATLAASMGGILLLVDCIRHGVTNWGTDATSLAQIYISAGGVSVNGHTGGESVVASTS